MPPSEAIRAVAHRNPRAVRRMVDATNAADNAAFLDSFTDDGVVDDWGREFVGREAIAGWNGRENIGVHSQFTFTRSPWTGRPTRPP